jgi:flagellar motility protein MotE (MotC chaperone)
MNMLFDLATDPAEVNNQWNDQPQVVSELKQRMDKIIAAQADKKNASYADDLTELRELAPVDKRYRQFIRYRQYKGIVNVDGTLQVCDMLHPKSGIGERFESMVDKPEIAEFMTRYLQDNNITARYVTIPDDAK